eukprot:TRINITY_DN23240_c0_g1_i3.p1 TRINITY_DN23240_c0_g1~~TRINITY_DN23240_c0_g1_i3.p1  ORF type:complete len:327 (-),score=50.09 TRINITY_DN23240_c0_g1_i3:189-1139(-)
MANKTDPEAISVRGTNPQNLVEKIVREKIYNTVYWKKDCFGLNAETLVDRAVELKAVGGTAGGNRLPCDFMCLILKMLQIQPDKDIIIEFIKQEDYKYLRLLGAFYLRLTGTSQDVYQYLEPLYNDPRKVRKQRAEGGFVLSHVDELIDEMLRGDFMFDISLPFVLDRMTMERSGQLQPWVSVLDEEFDETALIKDAGEHQRQREELEAELRERNEVSRRRSRSRSRTRSRSRSRDRYKSRDRRERSRERGGRYRDEEKRRDRSGSPHERRKKKEKKEKRDKKDKQRRHGDDNPEKDEIAEQNELRAKLGLKPLRV